MSEINKSDPTQINTIADALGWASNYFDAKEVFYGHGATNAWDEGVMLITHVTKLPIDVDKSVSARELTPVEKADFINLVEQRVTTRMPASYLIKKAFFAGLEFYVDERVLIPRSPMAELIENEFTPWKDPASIYSVLDLCTGSGCIAIACAHYLPHAQVDATDISEPALAVAKINAEKLDCGDRVNLVQSDLFSALSTKKYDVIISNPPYVDAIDMTDMPAENLHEPEIALAAGEDGLRYVLPILQQAKHHLNPNGILVVEVGNSEHALMERYPEIPFVWLEFERGGDGVFLLTAEDVAQIVV